jgi:hypothetical protein
MRDGSAARAAAAPAWQREELDQAEQPRHGEGRPGGTTFVWPGAEHNEANLLSAADECAIRSLSQLTAPDRMKRKNWLNAGFTRFPRCGKRCQLVSWP